MLWSSYNLSYTGSPNHAAYSAPNHAAYGALNHPASGAPNHAAYGGANHAAYAGPNHAAYGPLNHPVLPRNHPGYDAFPGPAPGGGAAPGIATGTGAGGASGTGFLGGYGPVARFEYATPAGLAPLPWVLDYATGDGWPSFPEQQLNPLACTPPLEWAHGDWDPGLRFWTLPFDPHLTEWLQDLNLAAPAVSAAREFAAHSAFWLAGDTPSPLQRAFENADGRPFGNAAEDPRRDLLAWRTDWPSIQRELAELTDLMRDDRLRYLEELAVQSSHVAPYFVHLMGFDPATRPWTMELMNCATAIGNLVKMQYKSHYRRVRPSTLCPGLVPPWGPPRHPAFPSGHSTVAHLTALLLLSVPGISQRFGIFGAGSSRGRPPEGRDFIAADAPHYGEDQRSPLLWLAWRVARGRERLGLHYRSDSAAGRRLAALVWDACVNRVGDAGPRIGVPALHEVLARAGAEWPALDRR